MEPPASPTAPASPTPPPPQDFRLSKSKKWTKASMAMGGEDARPAMVTYVRTFVGPFFCTCQVRCFSPFALFSVTQSMLKRKEMLKVVRIFHKPLIKRTPGDVEQATQFLEQHKLSLQFFRHLTRARIEALCRVMTAVTFNANRTVYDISVRGCTAY